MCDIFSLVFVNLKARGNSSCTLTVHARSSVKTKRCYITFFCLSLHHVSVFVARCPPTHRLPQLASCPCMGGKWHQALVLASKEGVLPIILQMHKRRHILSPVWP